MDPKTRLQHAARGSENLSSFTGEDVYGPDAFSPFEGDVSLVSFEGDTRVPGDRVLIFQVENPAAATKEILICPSALVAALNSNGIPYVADGTTFKSLDGSTDLTLREQSPTPYGMTLRLIASGQSYVLGGMKLTSNTSNISSQKLTVYDANNFVVDGLSNGRNYRFSTSQDSKTLNDKIVNIDLKGKKEILSQSTRMILSLPPCLVPEEVPSITTVEISLGMFVSLDNHLRGIVGKRTNNR